MIKNENLLTTFYNSFSRSDYKSMQKCYHPDVQFSDPVFPLLEGKQVLAMWHMLCDASKDLMIEHSNVAVYDNSASLNWKAVYTFGKTGRIVHNDIKATFTLKDNLIISHRDNFDFWKWSRMAFGTVGTLSGWTEFFKNKIRSNAARQLDKFIHRHPEYKY